MVFQDFALFPHLSAWNNARFGLPRGQGDGRVAWLFSLGLEGLEQRHPHQLSGGSGSVSSSCAGSGSIPPRVVLLMSPSSLDVEVRLHLRSELSSVLEACNASGVIVTHDPDEALAICNRVAVMRDGVLHQCANSPGDRSSAGDILCRFLCASAKRDSRFSDLEWWPFPVWLGDLDQQFGIRSSVSKQDGSCVLRTPGR